KRTGIVGFHRPDPPPEPKHATMQMVAPLVRRQHMFAPVQRQARAGDAVAIASDQDAEEGRIAEVPGRIRQAQHHVHRPVFAGHAQPREDAAKIEDVRTEATLVAEAMRTYLASIWQPAEWSDPVHAAPRSIRG